MENKVPLTILNWSRKILKNESKTAFVYDDISSYDEVQEGLSYPERNVIMIHSNSKQDQDKNAAP